MPKISAFYGILIRGYFNDHGPPRFHARYGEFEATIDIDTLEVLEGRLPKRAFELGTGMGDDSQRGVDLELAAVSRQGRTHRY